MHLCIQKSINKFKPVDKPVDNYVDNSKILWYRPISFFFKKNF